MKPADEERRKKDDRLVTAVPVRPSVRLLARCLPGQTAIQLSLSVMASPLSDGSVRQPALPEAAIQFKA